MQPTFHVYVSVNQTEQHRITNVQDVDRLCRYLATLPVFIVHVVGEDGEKGGTLDVIIESDRALVDFLDIERGIKLASCDETRTQRGVVSLRNDDYPKLALDQIEVHHRDLISPERAIAILRHYLMTGEVIDLVPWPPDDWEEWGDIVPDVPDENIPF